MTIAVTYTVTSGDSLFLIAKKFGINQTDLSQMNSLSTENIIPGEVLIIPGQYSRPKSYNIQNGDTLFLIAQKLKVPLANLIQKNNLQSFFILPRQTLKIPATMEHENTKSLKTLFQEKNINPLSPLQIVVEKSSHTLTLFAGDVWLKSYHVALGDGGLDPKQLANDHKTPEGFFYIVEKLVLDPNDQFLGSRWLRLGYPTSHDAIRGTQQGLITTPEYDSITFAFNNKLIPPQQTALGGGVGIHGGSDFETNTDWTWGCIGLANRDIEDFYQYVEIGTPIVIIK